MDNYGKLLTLKALLSGQQTQQLQQQGLQLENQQRQTALQDQAAQTKAMQEWDGKDYTQLPSLILKNGGSGSAVFAATQQIHQAKAQASEIAAKDAETNSKTLETQIKAIDQYRGRIQSIINAPADQKQQLWDSELTAEEQAGKIKPGAISHTYPGDSQATVFANHFALGSQLAKEANELQVARIRAGGSGAEPLTGDQINQLNQTLSSRYQVLNPGRSLPPQFALPANATQKDYDRIDKALEQTEKATGTKAQQDTANAMRQQSAEMVRQNQLDRQNKEGLQPVTGTDPNTGKDVLVPMSQAKDMGLTGVMKADADMVNKATAARHWLQLADKQGDAPESMGILQLIDKMDQEGKLGTVASRWNEFMSGRVGSGDPEFAALRAKMGLSATKLMQAHVGSRGGSFMLEHFEDLANAKKMDASTLRAGVRSELDYMNDVAMMPQNARAQDNRKYSSPPSGATMKVPGSDGKVHWSDGKQDLGVAE
jgi:hypothetical protein